MYHVYALVETPIGLMWDSFVLPKEKGSLVEAARVATARIDEHYAAGSGIVKLEVTVIDHRRPNVEV